jgi:hypothetical protein
MPKGIPKSGHRRSYVRKPNKPGLNMKFEIPDPTKYRISDCGMYLIEKLQLGSDPPVYAVWEYKRVLYGLPTSEEAVAAIKNREADHQEREAKYWQSREPCAKLLSHRGTYTGTNPTSAEST